MIIIVESRGNTNDNFRKRKKMKKIAIYCVNYNSYGELYAYYHSIVMAAQKVKDCCHIDLYIADNTEKSPEVITLPPTANVNPTVFTFRENMGYFGAIRRLMEQTEYTTYDYVIISNVDVRVDLFSVRELCQANFSNEVGWIAPLIFSETQKRNLNPALTKRYTERILRLIKLQFKFPILHKLYEKTLYKRKHIQAPNPQKNIYAGHGSFIILTNDYFKNCGIINYPVFLYGEELYLAEECRLHNLTVVYESNIKVHTTGKVSTGNMANKLYCKCNMEGINYILGTYYTE